jgi:hypothetical protein
VVGRATTYSFVFENVTEIVERMRTPRGPSASCRDLGTHVDQSSSHKLWLNAPTVFESPTRTPPNTREVAMDPSVPSKASWDCDAGGYPVAMLSSHWQDNARQTCVSWSLAGQAVDSPNFCPGEDTALDLTECGFDLRRGACLRSRREPWTIVFFLLDCVIAILGQGEDCNV